MLEELRIRGLGVIDEAVLPLGPGLTVVTGETGAGKTMVVSGLLLLFGGRGDAARVRSGADQASVDGRLELPAGSAAVARVRDAGGEWTRRRRHAARGAHAAPHRSAPRAGPGPTWAARRRRSRCCGELAEHLVAVHGQSDQLRLARPGPAAGDARPVRRLRPGRLHLGLRGAGARPPPSWTSAAAGWGSCAARPTCCEHGLAEIEAAAPLPGEDADLAAAAGRLAHADALRIAAHQAHDALLGAADDPLGDAADVTALLGAARRHLDQQAGADPELDAARRPADRLVALVTDLGADLGAYAAGLDADPERLEQLEARRAVLAALVRKYADGPEPDLGGVAALGVGGGRAAAPISTSPTRRWRPWPSAVTGAASRGRPARAASCRSSAARRPAAGSARPSLPSCTAWRCRAATCTVEVRDRASPGRTAPTRSRCCSDRTRTCRRCRWRAGRPAASCPG